METADFKYNIDSFADIKIMRYHIDGWEKLSLRQKTYVYYLSEAAKWGRDIIWDQNCRHNLKIRKAVETVFEKFDGERGGAEWDKFVVYAKRLFFSNGIHHHYALDKFVPECSQEYFGFLMDATGQHDTKTEILSLVFDPEICPMRQYTGTDKDMIMASAVNFYDGTISKDEVNGFYDKMTDPNEKEPVSYGLNSRLMRNADGTIVEDVYRIGGLYGKAISRIVENLEKAACFAENELQKKLIATLIEYYQTGDLKTWDRYNIEWVSETEGDIDFINGFIEDYSDPLGRKATWESLVNFRNRDASKRTQTISGNAQWFEDHSPVDCRFKKKEVKGVSAKVISAVCLGGDCYPSTPIGINLPNSNWIRKEYGSKSVTIENITDAYNLAAEELPQSMLAEFAWDDSEIELIKKYGNLTGKVHTDLHECLGHGSGQLLEGVSQNALGEYGAALEETRADLFGLYYIADPKLVELGILPDSEAYKAEYMSFIRNGVFTQFVRVELGKTNTEAHMQNRKLIAEWCFEQGKQNNIIERRVRNGKTYFVINDFGALRELFGRFLAEIQRIKSEGDYKAGKHLIEKYAISIDSELHREAKERYAKLNLKPYGGFVNPEIEPVFENGKICDFNLSYTEDYLGQMLNYGKKYATL